ncbi:TetR/AcrR family transcriptional regulator [Streptomyces sp. NPDC056337]|uniref:TetR/AcrR family transcriptional regulator n=1 Tax=Streptomyces sp. NPDC056337 TaxID=3345787 RepID=UPI0035DD23CE
MRAVTDDRNHLTHYREPRQARSAATLARMLQAAEELASEVGLEELTIAGVAERADMSVGSIYRRFEGKEQLISALTARMLDRREEYVAKQLRAAEPSLSGVLHVYAHALLRSFAEGGNLFTELLRTRAGGALDRGARTISEIHRFLIDAAMPYVDQIRRPAPEAALDTAARALLGACFHNSLRPDRFTSEAALHRYADELRDMALAYLLAPEPSRSSESP